MSEEKTIVEEKSAESSEEKLYGGKYKTSEDMEAGYAVLESKLGEQGNEIGVLKAEKTFLATQLEQKQPAPEKDTQPDFNAELAEIAKQVDEGDLSQGEGFQKTALISARMSAIDTANSIQKQQEQNMVDSSRNTFLGNNQDFEEVRNSGALETIKNELPGFHDDVSAFYEFKTRQSAAAHEAAMETVKAESFEAGKAEMAKIAGGAQDTQKVLQSGGESTKEIGRGNAPKTKLELEESGMAALRKAREG